MFSKEELRQRKTAFWDGLKQKMQNCRRANGRRTNWLNYKTGLKFLFIRLEADSKRISFCIDLQPKDEGIREVFWEQLLELKMVLEAEMGEGEWLEDVEVRYGQSISRILWQKEGLNMFKEEDKNEIYEFFQEKLLAFDRFYTDFDEILLTLAQ